MRWEFERSFNLLTISLEVCLPGALAASDLQELAKWVYTSSKLTLGEIADKLKAKILDIK